MTDELKDSDILAMAADGGIPLMERIRFAGIVGMLHDEFSMKRLSGLKRRVEKGSRKVSPGGSTADELFLTGTAAEVTPVREVDRRPVGDAARGSVTRLLQAAAGGAGGVAA